jgi:hypothetical protein
VVSVAGRGVAGGVAQATTLRSIPAKLGQIGPGYGTAAVVRCDHVIATACSRMVPWLPSPL